MKEFDIIKSIPELFEVNLNTDKSGDTIFRKLSKLIFFDEGFIFYANPDSLQLKFTYKNTTHDIDSIYPLTPDVKSFIFSKDGKVCDNSDKLISTIKLKNFELKSFIVSKISIRSTVFGIIVLASKTENIYKKNDLYTLDAASAILSYVLKDLELSNVFKIQLKALKDGIVVSSSSVALFTSSIDSKCFINAFLLAGPTPCISSRIDFV